MPKQQAEDAEEAEDFEVEGILGHEARTTGTGKRKKTEDFFLVRWVGYGLEHNTWEPRTSLGDCAEHIKDFENNRYARTRKMNFEDSGYARSR
jgi:hypothetical protein